jgi:hypothetical protein
LVLLAIYGYNEYLLYLRPKLFGWPFVCWWLFHLRDHFLRTSYKSGWSGLVVAFMIFRHDFNHNWDIRSTALSLNLSNCQCNYAVYSMLNLQYSLVPWKDGVLCYSVIVSI